VKWHPTAQSTAIRKPEGVVGRICGSYNATPPGGCPELGIDGWHSRPGRGGGGCRRGWHQPGRDQQRDRCPGRRAAAHSPAGDDYPDPWLRNEAAAAAAAGAKDALGKPLRPGPPFLPPPTPPPARGPRSKVPGTQPYEPSIFPPPQHTEISSRRGGGVRQIGSTRGHLAGRPPLQTRGTSIRRTRAPASTPFHRHPVQTPPTPIQRMHPPPPHPAACSPAGHLPPPRGGGCGGGLSPKAYAAGGAGGGGGGRGEPRVGAEAAAAASDPPEGRRRRRPQPPPHGAPPQLPCRRIAFAGAGTAGGTTLGSKGPCHSPPLAQSSFANNPS